MIRFAPLAAASLALAAAPVARAASDVPPEPGVYWEHTVEMQMPGMPFAIPPQKQKVCLPKKGADEQPPAAGDKKQKCKITDLKKSGARMTWKMKCEDGTTGEGDMTWEKEAYKGSMVMRTEGQEMTMKLSGRKVGGDCDAAEVKRMVATAQKQVKEAEERHAVTQAQQCEEAAAKVQVQLFVPFAPGVPATCKDPARFCAALATRDGLLKFPSTSRGFPDAKAKTERLCAIDLDALEAKHCAAAEKDRKAGKTLDDATLAFVFDRCPETAGAIAKKECSGRKFTDMPPAMYGYCTKWMQGELAAGKAGKTDKKSKKKAASDEDEEQPKPPEDMKSKIMKGLLPF